MVYRLFVERKEGFRFEAQSILSDLRHNLSIEGLTDVRLIFRYDVEGVSPELLEKAKKTIFSEPQSDLILADIGTKEGDTVFASEYLPGQFDQRADSCSQCIQLLSQGERPAVRTAKIYVLSGKISEEELRDIKKYMINPVESREASFDMPETLNLRHEIPTEVETLVGFTAISRETAPDYIKKFGLAMDVDDLLFCKKYFAEEEKRDPTYTELKMIDTYWSDHCRHTTFLTNIDKVEIEDEYVNETFRDYLAKRKEVYVDREKSITLMDMATMAAKYLKKQGVLKNLDESEEINACSIKVKVDVNGVEEDWLLMFKNETHNHPTEIEPFGGAATCLGGAIRDPLSGRSYVYQAMRVTGAADPRKKVKDTIPGKLPQSKLTVGAAQGYSSYGNQIGLATGGVYEIYHPNYVAKRLEIGAVVGAAPASNVIREVPEPGDVVILLGGRTGRDGCGGATGSSKAHTLSSLSTCGAEVQKGNPPEERKLQRLFRNPEATHLIKRCNDFGAGGVSVAIGELADGLTIDLSKVPKKYDGLDGTELAISESQERMAVVVAAKDADKFIALANAENLEATHVATVTDTNRLLMSWNGKSIVDISRNFLNSNGAEKHTDVRVPKINTTDLFTPKAPITDPIASLVELMGDLNVCSQRGLVSRFDSTIGAASAVLPYGGKHQLTPSQYMAAFLPVLEGETDTVSVMSYGFDPYLSEKSPYHGAIYAVIESVAKAVCAGADYKDIYLTFQEFFERTNNDPSRWGKPFAALMGAFKAQTELSIAAIGGKDSMSGTFENIDVPPTLVSFTAVPHKGSKLITGEFKKPKSNVYLYAPTLDENGLPNFDSVKKVFNRVHKLMEEGKILSAYAVSNGGVAEAVAKMAFGNKIGFRFSNYNYERYFAPLYGAILVETDKQLDAEFVGRTLLEPSIIMSNNDSVCLCKLISEWEKPLETVFPTVVPSVGNAKVEAFSCADRPICKPKTTFVKPKVIIPVFPGTNCEYDTYRRFVKAGAEAEIFVLRNLTPAMLSESLEQFSKKIAESQILMLPGGFSGGDEPDGSGKFITAVLRNPLVKESVTKLIEERGGLVLGICNGFQALVKSGLLPYGRILDVMEEDSPTLTFNAINRHQSQMVSTRIASVKSPWLAGVEIGDVHTIAISHGEGRFTANEAWLKKLIENGQIATQYVDTEGNPTMDIRYNPNASDLAIEGIFSPDGRIFGKMGHSERIGRNVGKNIYGEKDQKIFESGVRYFN